MFVFVVDEILKQKNMTQTELAKNTGIHPATLSSICRNTCKTVGKVVLYKICREFQCDLHEILVKSDTK